MYNVPKGFIPFDMVFFLHQIFIPSIIRKLIKGTHLDPSNSFLSEKCSLFVYSKINDLITHSTDMQSNV